MPASDISGSWQNDFAPSLLQLAAVSACMDLFLLQYSIDFGVFFYVLNSTLPHLPPPQIPLYRMMLGSNRGLMRLAQWQSDALTTKLDLIQRSLSSQQEDDIVLFRSLCDKSHK